MAFVKTGYYILERSMVSRDRARALPVSRDHGRDSVARGCAARSAWIPPKVVSCVLFSTRIEVKEEPFWRELLYNYTYRITVY